jgi:hypothetical protein
METSKLSWADFNSSKKDHVTIEHIYPVTPEAGDWPQFEARPPDDRLRLTHSLGNLLALSQSRNSKASNRPFIRKKQDCDGVRGYFINNGSYSEIAVAQFPDWTPETVLERGLAMLHFLESRWDVSLGTRGEKLELLNLGFLEEPGTSAASTT